MTGIALALFASAASAVCPIAPMSGPEDELRAAPTGTTELEELYRAGMEFSDFLADATRRRELWVRHYEEGAVDPALVERVETLGGRWRILAIAEDWCSDSVNTIPFLALLVDAASNLEMRVIDSDAGRDIMEAHRTPDGRAATPTVLVLDASYDQAGCWIERPADLQAWALDARPGMSDREFLTKKMAWYGDDAGASTVREIVEILEGAAAGTATCPAE